MNTHSPVPRRFPAAPLRGDEPEAFAGRGRPKSTIESAYGLARRVDTAKVNGGGDLYCVTSPERVPGEESLCLGDDRVSETHDTEPNPLSTATQVVVECGTQGHRVPGVDLALPLLAPERSRNLDPGELGHHDRLAEPPHVIAAVLEDIELHQR